LHFAQFVIVSDSPLPFATRRNLKTLIHSVVQQWKGWMAYLLNPSRIGQRLGGK
jgi:hypothetical protein